MADNKGVWLDKDTGKVVKSRPTRGRQLVAPGKDMDQDKVDAIVERYTAPAETATASAADVETAVDTKSTKRKS